MNLIRINDQNKYLRTLLFLFVFLMFISLTSSNPISNRILNKNETNLLNNSDELRGQNNSLSNEILEENNNSNSYNGINISNFGKYPGSYLLEWYIIFFAMISYMEGKIKSYPETKDRREDVWRFMFFANNGILVAASINLFNPYNMFLHNRYIDGSPFVIGTIIFIIGCFCYIYTFKKKCNIDLAEQYFSCKLPILPCFIWKLIDLTDPCYRRDNNTKT